MNKLLRLQNIVSSFLITTVACSAVVVAPRAFAETSEDDMSKLYLDAVTASSDKDYATAVKKFKAYLELDPDNQDAIDGLKEAEAALKAETEKPTTEAAAPAKTNSVYDQIVSAHKAIYEEAAAAVKEADILIARGKPADALKLLSEVESALPETSAAEAYRNQIALSRQRANIALRGEGNANLIGEQLTEQQARVIRDKVVLARRALDRAHSERGRHMLAEAIKSLDEAKDILPNITSTRELAKDIDVERALVYAEYFFDMVARRSPAEAASYMKMVGDLLGTDHKIYRQLAEYYKEWRPTAAAQNPATINPNFIKAEAEARELLAKAKAQYLYGDYNGAMDNYKRVLLHLPDNAEAKAMQIRIQQILSNSRQYNHELMREVMLNHVSEGWNLAQTFVPVGNNPEAAATINPIEARMAGIKVPVSLRDAPLQRAIETLSELSQSYDPVGKGVDIILIDPETKNPPHVNLTMKEQPLNKVLDTMLRTVGYKYEIKGETVEVRPDIGASDLEMREFPLPPKVVDHMRMRGSSSNSSGGFGSSGSESAEEGNDNQVILNFFKGAGIEWDGGRSLTYVAGTNSMYVTQDQKNLARIDTLLRKLNVAGTQQVHLEAKFIEVNQSVLNQVVTNWQLSKGSKIAKTNNRTVAAAHLPDTETSYTRIMVAGTPAYIDEDGVHHEATKDRFIPESAEPNGIPQPPPQVTRQPNYGDSNYETFNGVIGTVGDYDLRLILNAVNNSDGVDLMAAPSLTAIAGFTATIKIVQLLRWPTSYDDMQIEVSSNGNWNNNNNNNNNNNGGNASVGITPGTPQFDEEATEVGIQMTVTPQVNMEDRSITLDLQPKILEFEGFVEYGGTAVAIAGQTIVTTPAGFFQPVFNLREVTTQVEVYDGATVVIGGLTREEIRTVNDKVPILGDLPLIGSAFRSTGKSVAKKHLLIFVTANMMARGGGTATGHFRGVQNGATYSNPSVFTSGGPVYREFESPAEDTALVSEQTTNPASER